jgi:DNA polymerase I-like protein with 3'-5' exonuclease and polymerase domains
MGVASDYLKDIVNRSIQGSGHDIFVLFNMFVERVFMRERISYAPYVWDIHDCVMLEVPEEQAQRAKELLDGPVLDELNSFLNGSVKFKGEANIVDNWAQDKFE